MDYEKKYNDLVNDLKELWNCHTNDSQLLGELAEICPELRESEDERIRKWIYAYIMACPNENFEFYGGVGKGRVLAYLEKQKLPTDEEMLRTLRVEYEKGVADTIAKYEQKEQEEIPLMNGDADLYFDNWIQHNDTTKRGCFEEGIRYAQRLQKEQKPLSTEETELNSIAFLEQMGYTCIPPKKEHQNNSDAPKNALGGALNSPLDKDKNLDDIAQDYVEAVKEYNPEPTWNLMQTAVCYGYHYREGEEQKPVEWSEEDGEARKDAIKLLEAYYTDAIEDYCPHNAETLKKLIDFLKSLRPQPKVEWSEEDKIKLDNCCAVIAQQETYFDISLRQKCLDFLYGLPERFSPQPKQEWSEEDENALKYLHELISWGYAEKFMDAQTAHDMRKWVNEHLHKADEE